MYWNIQVSRQKLSIYNGRGCINGRGALKLPSTGDCSKALFVNEFMKVYHNTQTER